MHDKSNLSGEQWKLILLHEVCAERALAPLRRRLEPQQRELVILSAIFSLRTLVGCCVVFTAVHGGCDVSAVCQIGK